MSDDLVKRLRDDSGDWLTDLAADRIEELEAKLAGAVEALESLADCVDDGCFCSEIQMAAAMDAARTTLAKLTGGKDE